MGEQKKANYLTAWRKRLSLDIGFGRYVKFVSGVTELVLSIEKSSFNAGIRKPGRAGRSSHGQKGFS